jgi:hypothetical protein
MIKINEIIFKNSINELKLSADVQLTKNNLVKLHNIHMDILKSKNTLPIQPHPEKHPYKDVLKLNKNYKKFIIGTFPPHTYQSDLFVGLTYFSGKQVLKPKLPFYHGNRELLWKYLLGEKKFNSLDKDRDKRKVQIIEFLKNKKINYADIIDYCQRKEYNANDSNLYNIILNEDLVHLLTIKNNDDILLVFNTGSFFTSSGMSFNKEQKFNPKTFVFDIFVYLLIQNKHKVEIQIMNGKRIGIEYSNRDKLKNIKNILSFYLFIDGKRFSVVSGPSPANGDGRLQENQIFKRFIKRFCPNKSYGSQKKEFKQYVYQTALLGNYHELEFLNID